MPKVCRTCLKEITSADFISINDSTVTTSLNSIVVKQELAICIPELDLNLVTNPVVCNPCVNDLHAAYDFKRKCLQTEERIHTYIQSSTPEISCVELTHLMSCNNGSGLRVDNDLPRMVAVKEEPDAAQKEFDEELNSYRNNLTFEHGNECYIKTDPLSTFTHSNDALSNSVKNQEQVDFMDFSFSNHNTLSHLPELGEDSSKMVNSKTHKKTPTSEMPFKCAQCDYSTSDKRNLTRHIQSHTDHTTASTNATIAKRRTFTIEDKVDLIRMLESGTKMAEVCRQTGLATSTVCCIMKKKDDILKAFEKNGVNLKRLRKPTHADVDEVLLTWCKEQQSMDVSLTGPILKVKAEELARSIGNYDFVCTNGWLDRFKVRYNICIGKRKS